MTPNLSEDTALEDHRSNSSFRTHPFVRPVGEIAVQHRSHHAAFGPPSVSPPLLVTRQFLRRRTTPYMEVGVGGSRSRRLMATYAKNERMAEVCTHVRPTSPLEHTVNTMPPRRTRYGSRATGVAT